MPVLARTLLAVDRAASIDEIVIAAREEELLTYAQLCKSYGVQKPVKVVPGGATRTESVLRAALEASEDAVFLAVQDGARPLVTSTLIDDVVAAAQCYHAAAPAIPVTDTIKRAGDDGQAMETLNRDELRAMQTPQAFQLPLLRRAHELAEQDGFLGTDDAALLEHAGLPVYLTLGDKENLKLTTPADMAFGEAILTLRREKEALA